jgi:hypothetical protein
MGAFAYAVSAHDQTEWQQSGLAVRCGDPPTEFWFATGGAEVPGADRQRAVRAALRAGIRRWQAARDIAPGQLGRWWAPAATQSCPRAAALMTLAARSAIARGWSRRRDRDRAKGASRQLPDAAQIGPLIIAAERDRDPRGAGPRGSADAMHVIFGHEDPAQSRVGFVATDIAARGIDVDGVSHVTISSCRTPCGAGL